jgi:hypothetical protein
MARDGASYCSGATAMLSVMECVIEPATPVIANARIYEWHNATVSRSALSV